MRKLLSRGLIVALVLGLTYQAFGQGGGDAKAVIEKAVAAHGGAKNLDKLKLSRMKGKGTVTLGDMDLAFSIDVQQQLPGKSKTVLKLDVMGMDISIVQILNGEQGWLSLGDKTMDADADNLSQMKASQYVSRLSMLTPLLTDKGFTLTALGESKVNDKAVVGVKVASAGQKDVSLYFDKASGLLVKLTRPGVDPIGKQAVSQDEFFNDYKDFNGLKQPTKLLVHQDGKKFMVAEMSEMTFPATIDAKVFTKPE